jgi:AcrR family transcriptional regulator
MPPIWQYTVMPSKIKKSSLRYRQAVATNEQILAAAMNLLAAGAANFSHETIARAAGMGARTVYRHFPDRTALLQALWLRVRDTTNTKFPTDENDVPSFARSIFKSFDGHESLVRAVLSSAAGTEVRERGGVEGRAAFAQSLGGLLAGLGVAKRAWIIAVFVAIYSAPFWQLLRDRGGLTGPEAQEAAAWLLEVLLEALQKNKKKNRKRNANERTSKKR